MNDWKLNKQATFLHLEQVIVFALLIINCIYLEALTLKFTIFLFIFFKFFFI